MSNKFSKEGKMKGYKEIMFCSKCKLETNHIILQSVEIEGIETLCFIQDIPIEQYWYDYYQTIQCQGCDLISFRHVNYFSEFDSCDGPDSGITKKIYLVDGAFNLPIDSTQDIIDDSKKNIVINPDQQTIRIGDYCFESFEYLFNIVLLKNKKIGGKPRLIPKKMQSQKKGGVILIYALARYIQENKDIKNIMIDDLISYNKEFREKWDKWLFAKQGKRKCAFTETDCDTVNSVLGFCKLKIRLKLNKKDKKIFIKE